MQDINRWSLQVKPLSESESIREPRSKSEKSEKPEVKLWTVSQLRQMGLSLALNDIAELTKCTELGSESCSHSECPGAQHCFGVSHSKTCGNTHKGVTTSAQYGPAVWLSG